MMQARASVIGGRPREAVASPDFSRPRRVQRCGIGSTCDCAEEQQRAAVERDISAATAGGGAPLPEVQRAAAERALGHDFSAVRIHGGGAAGQVATGLHARALTAGTDVLVRDTYFRPGTADGNRLLYHELAHVAQQAQGVAGSWIDSGRSDPLEIAADRAAERIQGIENHAATGLVPERSGGWVAGAGHRPRIQRQALFFEGPIPEFPLEEFPLEEVGPETGAPEVEPEVGAPELEPEAGAPEPVPDTGLPEPSPDVEPEAAPEPEPDVAPELGPEPVPPIVPAPPEEPDDEDQGCGSKKLPLTKVTWTTGPQGQGGAVKASPLTRCPGNTVGTPAWRGVYQDQFDCIVKTGTTPAQKLALARRWVAAHLLHGMTRRSLGQNLHGPGDQRWNIIIANNTVNARMNSFVEGRVVNLLYKQDRVLWYEVHVADYWPHSPFVARAITMSYGLYDTATGSEGPPLQSQSVWSDVRPPACPATPAPALTAPALTAPAGGAPPVPAASPPGFTSTVSICYQVLTSRTFPVRDGGLTVALRAGWVPTSARSACPAIRDYTVSLMRKGLIFDSTVSETGFPVGRTTKLSWKRLAPDDYYLVISVPDHDPTCCLRGGISVTMFSAPRPLRIRRPRGPMLA